MPKCVKQKDISINLENSVFISWLERIPNIKNIRLKIDCDQMNEKFSEEDNNNNDEKPISSKMADIEKERFTLQTENIILKKKLKAIYEILIDHKTDDIQLKNGFDDILKNIDQGVNKLKQIVEKDSLLGVRVAKSHKQFGLIFIGLGISFVLASWALPRHFAFAILALGGVIIFGGFFITWSGVFFSSVFNKDYDLLLKIEEIGGYKIPFGKTWRRQYKVSIKNPLHRKALILESLGIITLYLTIIVLLYGIIYI